MEKKSRASFYLPLFEEIPVIGILRNFDMASVARILPIFEEAGLSTIEITMNSPDAAKIIRYACNEYGDRLNIGAGTVFNEELLLQALDAGAQFIVTPIVEENVIRSCVSKNIPVFPGAYTPTEIAKAWSLHATMVKVFPASALGPAYFRDVLGPLGHIELLATGGITLDTIGAYLSAGVKGFGIGTPLFPGSIIEKGDWELLKKHFTEFKQGYISARTKSF